MSPIIKNPTCLDAMQAGRLAQRCYELDQALQTTRNPNVAAAFTDMSERRQNHHARTGWVSYHDGETTTYHYTDPTREDTP